MTKKKNFTINNRIKSLSVIFLIALFIFSFPKVYAQYDLSGNKIVSDSLGDNYVAGSFTNKNLSFGDYNISNLGGSDIFLAKYNSNGKIVWAKNIGGTGNEKLISLNVNSDGIISISGSSNSDAVIIGKSHLRNEGSLITFSAEFNSDGNLIDSKINNQILSSNFSLNRTTSNDTSLTLISPGSGDQWKVGAKVEVKWNSKNVNSVLIELSTDNGSTWQEIGATSEFDFSNEFTLLAPNSPSNSCLIRISDKNNPSVSDTSNLFSISGKLYWKTEESEYNSVLRSVYFANSSTGWAAGYNGLIVTNDAGRNWSSELSGYGLLDVYFLNSNVGWTVGLSGTIFKTVDGGSNWTQVKSGHSFNFQKVYFLDENNGYIIGNGTLLKTIDGGKSWNSIKPTDHVIQTMYFVNKDTGWVAGNEGVILQTKDGGDTWFSQQENGTSYGTLTSLFFVNADTGWATGSGLDIKGGVILKTTDGGNNWVLQHNGDNSFIYSVSFSGPDTGWASGDNGIMFNTTDGGNNWVLEGSGTFESLYSVNMSGGNSFWSVGNDGVILKYNSDETPASSTTGIAKTQIPNEYSLTQNYPNPFNPSTKIQYSVSKNVHVTLKVYDVLGREVATLLNEDKSAGSYTVNFNASNLASGTYIYRFVAGNYVNTKKMVLLK